MKIIIVTVLLFVLNFLSSTIQSQPVSVMSFNLRFDTPADGENRWDNRKDDVVGLFRFYDPGITGTQEGLKHQLDYIDNHLKNHTYVGVARGDGVYEGEYSAIFVDTLRFEIEDQGTFWLSETPDEPSTGWDADIKRVCTFALLKNKNDGKRFYLFNAHLDHIGEESRKQSVSLMWQIYQDKTKSNPLPVIMMGDLNAEPGDDPIVFLSGKLQDAYKITEQPPYGPEGTFNAFNREKPADRRIDYIFVSDEFRVKKYATLADINDLRFPSDHFPVFAEIEW